MAGRFALAKFCHPELGSAVIEHIVLNPAASILSQPRCNPSWAPGWSSVEI
jgi:hypothetical protein